MPHTWRVGCNRPAKGKLDAAPDRTMRENGNRCAVSTECAANEVEGSARVGPQAVIDIPSASGAAVADTFIVAGWAVDSG